MTEADVTRRQPTVQWVLGSDTLPISDTEYQDHPPVGTDLDLDQGRLLHADRRVGLPAIGTSARSGRQSALLDAFLQAATRRAAVAGSEFRAGSPRIPRIRVGSPGSSSPAHHGSPAHRFAAPRVRGPAERGPRTGSPDPRGRRVAPVAGGRPPGRGGRGSPGSQVTGSRPGGRTFGIVGDLIAPRRLRYSARSAGIGSSPATRRAGIAEAGSAARTMTAATAANVAGS